MSDEDLPDGSAYHQRVLLQAAFDLAPVGMGVVDPDGHYILVNRALCGLLGRGEDDLVGSVFLTALHPDDVDAELRRLERLVHGEVDTYEGEGRRIRPDGTVIWVHEQVSIAPAQGAPVLPDGSGRPGYVIRQLVDVTEQRELAAALDSTGREAAAASRAKTEFLAQLSHELRTPLTSVLGFAELLEHEHLPRRARGAVAQITDAGRHLVRLVDELLDIARLEDGGLPVSLEPVGVAGVLAEVAGLVEASAKAAGLVLSVDPPTPGCPPVMADRTHLVEILLNLASNAVKFSSAGGSVALSARLDGGRFELTVRDTGPGLSAAEQRRLFRRFERLGAEQRGIPGAGLGLVVSRSLAEAMGGELSLESAPGQGSAFTLRLCVATSPPAVPEARRPAFSQERHGALTGRPWSVLYIEDESVNARLVDAVLCRFTDAELTVAPTGTEGLKQAAARRPDIVLLDLDLLDLPAAEILTRLKADPATATVPVVVIGTEATWQGCGLAGAARFVAKPVAIGDLLDALSAALGEA